MKAKSKISFYNRFPSMRNVFEHSDEFVKLLPRAHCEMLHRGSN